jgi:hypothetical protein
MESMIDFLRFRLCEREGFIALSTVNVQGRCPGAMLSPPGGECQHFLDWSNHAVRSYAVSLAPWLEPGEFSKRPNPETV